MRLRVLGSAAGGGVPQWNCACENCTRARQGLAPARTQCCLAVSSDDVRWFLFGATPDVRQQIESFASLHPRAPRGTRIAGLILHNGDLDACAGFLSLREDEPLRAVATGQVRRAIVEENAWMRTLARFHGQLTWEEARLDGELPLRDARGEESGLTIVPVAAPGKVPVHDVDRRIPSMEDNVGFWIRESRTGKTVAFFPSVGAPTRNVERILDESDVVFFDGTFWSTDELTRTTGQGKSAAEMAHWPLSGEEGSLAFLARARARQKYLIHVNNTNPVLKEGSEAHAALGRAGVSLSYDGMELVL